MKKTETKRKSNTLILGIIAVIVIAMAAFTGIKANSKKEVLAKQPNTVVTAITDENGDVIIPIADLSETATFYSYDKLDTEIEFLAVKAPDGTIRTAFNTCQVCYASGRGYYVQEGDVLVCQNCGNVFEMDQVEKIKGGCNPVPIIGDHKEVTASSIIIKSENFTEAESLFANWKN